MPEHKPIMDNGRQISFVKPAIQVMQIKTSKSQAIKIIDKIVTLMA